MAVSAVPSPSFLKTCPEVVLCNSTILLLDTLSRENAQKETRREAQAHAEAEEVHVEYRT
jgi:hypothetical protein